MLSEAMRRVSCAVPSTVLILVLVEHALGEELQLLLHLRVLLCLNPCFSGTCSRSVEEFLQKTGAKKS